MKRHTTLSPIRAQNICCPNCGSRSAERHWIEDENTVRTQCPECDYLLISCSLTANVVEAYFPSSTCEKVA
ncbi:replication restart DNA helicase PriA [filamentous cyanobacterium LEGE 11480]|uniref:Replication restart DNA helicase PriA n=1 Tax=Romeriopsis navalis LEGE 11480 TaxID=2777977 RepID=A0A928Z1S4_9CYAN|nr:replication restart DNA helicase PriA [Romeriopsis navalis]MBE9028789.1 replication restart DNA helicase PriA [Romeriopsis navalis LEGE 11480]